MKLLVGREDPAALVTRGLAPERAPSFEEDMRGTLLYVGQRLVLIAVTTALVSSIVFVLLHQIPGNAFLNETRQSRQTLAAELHHYGLDLPLQQQYAKWVQGVLHGDLGESLVNRGIKIMPLLIRETS